MSIDIKEKADKAFDFHKSGNFSEAERLYIEVLSFEPSNINVLNLLGLLKFAQKQYQEALTYILKAVEISPQAYFYLNLGRIYFSLNRIEESTKAFEEGLKLQRNDFELWFNYAFSLNAQERFEEAIEAYKKAIELNPKLAEAYNNLSKLYSAEKDDPHTAIEYYKKFLELEPNDMEVLYFLSVMYLKIKDFENGWKFFENRLCRECSILTQEKELADKIRLKPIWQGEDIQGKTVFVYFEGGLGETTMFGRFLPILKERGAKKVYFRPQSCYYKLFKENESNLDVEVINNVFDIDFDLHIPLLSLPYAMKIYSEKEIPNGSYLKANKKKSIEYKEKYFQTNKIKIGFKWQGNTSYDLTRIIKFESFYKIFPLKEVQFYSLQKDDAIEKLEKAKEMNFEIIDLGTTFESFDDTAAAIDNLDLVICNDTSVAHLAATINKPCWVLLPFIADWRWHMDTKSCLWYKNVKVFKQRKKGDWDSVFDEVYEELKNTIL